MSDAPERQRESERTQQKGRAGPEPAVFTFQRDVRLFARQPEVIQRLEKARVQVQLAPDQLFHPDVPCDGAVRLGNLRISEILADGREVTRAVLQAGAVFTTRADAGEPEARPDDAVVPGKLALSLPDSIIMAIGATELWVLPEGRLDDVV